MSRTAGPRDSGEGEAEARAPLPEDRPGLDQLYPLLSAGQSPRPAVTVMPKAPTVTMRVNLAIRPLGGLGAGSARALCKFCHELAFMNSPGWTNLHRKKCRGHVGRPRGGNGGKSVVKPAKIVLLADTLLALYRQMLRIRRCEERLIQSFHEGLVPGPYSSCLGQEAIYVGVCHHLQADDVIFGTHRGQGQAVAKGMGLTPLMAELYGRAAGCLEGRGGPFFLYDPERGLHGSSGIAGSALLQATGAAYAFQLRQVPRVAVAFFGEGAASCGAFHEALNLAGLWKLPVLFICEKNQYVGRVPSSRAVANLRFSLRAKLYDMPGVEVDGNDVAAVYAAAYEGILRAREGKGPTLVECATRRVRPHVEGDFLGLETAEALEPGAGLPDPLDVLGQRLVADQHCDDAELTALDHEVRREVGQAHQAALASGYQGDAPARSPDRQSKAAD
jgi:TPP-dependent pyruvate/acetoin dehydrogenase alpha subunit